jgi:uncharacterized HAD superfamily protein
MKIAFDLDDILASFQIGWVAYNNLHYGTSLKVEDIVEYNYSKIMNLSNDETFRRIIEFWESTSMDELLPTQHSQQVISKLKNSHELFIITSRDQSIKAKTDKWINTYFPNTFSQIFMTSQVSRDGYNHKVTKADICVQQNISLLVEDAPIYVEDTTKAGVYVALINKPWNRTYQFQHEKLLRLNDLTDIEPALPTLQ